MSLKIPSCSRKNRLRRVGALLTNGLFTGYFCLAGHVCAQTNVPSPGQLVPKVLPIEPAPPPSLVMPETVPRAENPAAGDVVELMVGSFRLEDRDPVLAELAKRTLGPLHGRKLRVAAIHAAIAELEQAYVDRGHFLTRIIIPPQHVADGGDMHLEVIHGFIQCVDVDGVPEVRRSRVARILAPLTNNPYITRAEFERALLIASDLPGLIMRASLRTAPEVGAVVLVVTGETKLDHGELSVDNSLPKLLGQTSATLSGTYTAASGPIDQLYFTGSAPVTSNPVSTDSPRGLLLGGLRSAVGVNGAAIDANITWSRTKPELSPGVLDTDSTFDRAALRGTYPLMKTRATTLVADAAFDVTSEQESATQFGQTLYDDQLRVLRAGISVAHVFGLSWEGSAGVDVSRGLHILGARGPGQATADDPLSQQGASDVFTKWEWHGSLHHELPPNAALDLQVHGQEVDQPLLLSEKFTLGGPTDLSAYDTASFSGDRGWVARGEVQRQFDWRPVSVATRAQVYVFGAYGQVVMIQPTAAEQRTSAGSSAGFGVRTSTARSRAPLGPLDLTAEVAREFNQAGSPSPKYWRAHFALTLHF